MKGGHISIFLVYSPLYCPHTKPPAPEWPRVLLPKAFKQLYQPSQPSGSYHPFYLLSGISIAKAPLGLVRPHREDRELGGPGVSHLQQVPRMRRKTENSHGLILLNFIQKIFFSFPLFYLFFIDFIILQQF